MSNRILEKDGVSITHLDGARFNRFCAGYKDGIIKKSYKECLITLVSSNVIQIDKGELLIDGFRIVVEQKQITFSTLPSASTNYSIIARFTLDASSEPAFDLIVRTDSALVQEDLFDESLTSRIYEIEMARFVATSEGLSDLSIIVPIISNDRVQDSFLPRYLHHVVIKGKVAALWTDTVRFDIKLSRSHPITTYKEIVDILIEQGYISNEKTLNCLGDALIQYNRAGAYMGLGIYATGSAIYEVTAGVSFGTQSIDINGTTYSFLTEAHLSKNETSIGGSGVVIADEVVQLF